MNWKSNRQNESCLFRELSAGQTFEYKEIYYIKISGIVAFDIINNKIVEDWLNEVVQPVGHEIIITDDY